MRGQFPYYGQFVTEPAEAAATFQQGPFALVEETLLLQFGAEVGDSIRLGESTFTIHGKLLDIPGENLVFSVAAPRVLIPLAKLEETQLAQLGGRSTHYIQFLLDPLIDPDKLVEEIKPQLREQRLRDSTVEERKRRLGRALTNLYRFLNLVAFIALLLGSVGIASAINHYIRQKLSTVAVLRCLGSSSLQTFFIYLIQAAAMGFISVLVGIGIGLTVLYWLPVVLADFLPVSIPFAVSIPALAKASVLGLGMALLFALLPLLPVRRVSPLLVLRSDYEADKDKRIDPLQILLFVLIFGFILGFSLLHTEHWIHGVIFAFALVVAFALLVGAAKLVAFLVRRYFPRSWSYIWRQGLANLYRPHNQTVLLMLSIGLGTFFIVTLYLIQETLLSQAALSASGSRPNLVLFDIQTHQKESIRELLQEVDLPILQDVPIVTMRLSSIKGKTIKELRDEEGRHRGGWALAREYRSTYRDSLIETESLVAGEWTASAEGLDIVPISLEKGIAENLSVAVGDELVFDVQGLPVTTQVGSLREVEWERIQPNFFAVFPVGVLEKAPQFHVLVTRTGTAAESAEIQKLVVKKFPNVAAIDLALVMSAIDNILDKAAFVIRFMALFSIFTGFTVLAGSVVAGRYQRLKEVVLLRTLGASRRQVLKIMLVEYFFLGTFASLIGLLLAFSAGWALAYFVFETTFVSALLPIFVAFVMIVGLTIVIGLLNSLTVLDRPPLEVLRKEAA
jgi:putative ABC transport system permease protein